MLARLNWGNRGGAVRPLCRVRAGQARQGSQPRLLPPGVCQSMTRPRSPTDLVPSLPPAPGSVCFPICVG
jgi:hypothetical protein